jgi:glycosyltransferase involved in cell wall biosynthesis
MEAFAEYLSEDFEVVVFAEHPTLKKAHFKDTIQVYYSSGHFLLERLKNNPSDHKLVHYFKTACNIVLHKLIKNPLASWRNKIVQKLAEEHQKKAFDFIISSSPYQDSHEVVLTFLTSHKEVKWMCDLRDELSTNPYIQENVKAIEKYKRLETQINANAFLVTSVSSPLLETFQKTFIQVNHFLEIKNGFNHDLNFPIPLKQSDKNFKIGYFGTFYGIHKPDVFFEAITELIQEQPQLRVDIEFYGTHKNIFIPVHLKGMVQIKDRLEYIDAIKKMHEMDLNLLMIPISKSKGIYSGKIFDYISARKPILAIIDKEGVAASLIEETHSGYIADYNSVSEIKLAIQNAISDCKNDIYKVASTENINSLHRKIDVLKLAAFFTSVTKG